MLQTEFEIKFFVENRDVLIEKIKKLGGVQKHPQVLMKRKTFDHTSGYDNTKFIRVRDEGSKITLTYKQIGSGSSIIGVSELEVEVSDFEKTVAILENIGIPTRNYQETKREKWIIKTETGNIELCIDIRPGCPEFLEIEGTNQVVVEEYATKLGFDITTGFFGTADFMYELLGICSRDEINHREKLTFDDYPVA